MSALPPIYTETALSPDFDMILVEVGTFRMGGDDPEAWDNEKPVHQVEISSFYLGKYAVTQALWQSVMGKNPADFVGASLPVENTYWDDIQIFLRKINDFTHKFYRLPSEAEWEYAARGGRYSEGYLYAGSDKLKEVGWYKDNSKGQPQPVGLKIPNELGLFDMSGNVYEWCEDYLNNNYDGAPRDGTVWQLRSDPSVTHVLRGGSCVLDASKCRTSFRSSITLGRFQKIIFGFRLALPAGSVQP